MNNHDACFISEKIPTLTFTEETHLNKKMLDSKSTNVIEVIHHDVGDEAVKIVYLSIYFPEQ